MKTMLHWLDRLEHFLLASIFILMVVLYSSAILAREISIQLAQRVEWVDEATRYLMVWMVFLGLGLALARGRQIAMSSYLDRFPEKWRMRVGRVIDAVGLAFSLYVVWFGWDITLLVLNSGQTSPTLRISNAYLYLSLPVGFLLLSLRYGLSLAGILDRRSNSDLTASAGH